VQFGFVIIFVPDVKATIDFYERAFGAKRKILTQAFGTLDTGATTLAFGSEENERKELGKTAFRANSPQQETAGFQVSFIADDVQAAYDKAISEGAVEVYPPQHMPWGQWVSRVRDLNGVLVSLVTTPRF
jgi:lactoylglutathione lyase